MAEVNKSRSAATDENTSGGVITAGGAKISLDEYVDSIFNGTLDKTMRKVDSSVTPQKEYVDFSLKDQNSTAKTNKMHWETSYTNSKGGLEKQPYSNDYLFDMNIFLYDKNKDHKFALKRPLHATLETLPPTYEWARHALEATVQQWDKMADNPKSRLLLDNLRQSGYVFYLENGYVSFGEKELPGVVGATFYMLGKDGFTNERRPLGQLVKDAQDMVGWLGLSSYHGEKELPPILFNIKPSNPHNTTTLIHECVHASDYGFSKSGLFETCYNLDKSDHDAKGETTLIGLETLANFGLRNKAEKFARVVELWMKDPDSFQQNFPHMNDFLEKVYFPALEVHNIGNQIGDKASKEAIQKAKNLPEGFTWSEFFTSKEDKIQRMNKDMDAFRESMTQLSHDLQRRHMEYTSDKGDTKGVSAQQLTDFGKLLESVSTHAVEPNKSLYMISVLETAPDLSGVKGPDRYFRAVVSSLSRDQTWWKDFCAHAQNDGPDSSELAMMKGLAAKNYPQAQLFMGEYMMEVAHDLKSARQYLTMAQNNPLNIGYTFIKELQEAMNKLDTQSAPVYSSLQKAYNATNQQTDVPTDTASKAKEPKGGLPVFEVVNEGVNTATETNIRIQPLGRNR